MERSRTIRKLVPVGLVALALLAAACSGSPKPASSSSTGVVKIAIEGPITGDQSSNGVDMERAARLAVDEANADGGVMGRRIQLIPADDKADPETGKQVAQQMVDQGVYAVVGPYNSGVGVENLPIYVKAGVIPIHLTSNVATDGMGFTVQPKDYQIAPVEADAITGLYHAKSVAMVYDPSTYTADIADQVRTTLEQNGVDVVAFEKVDPSKNDFVTQVRKITAKKPDLFYASTYFPEGAPLAKDLQQVNFGGTCFMGLANQDPGFVDKAGVEASQACVTSGVPSPDLFSEATKYVSDYKAKFGADPGTWGTFTYDSVNLLFDAVQRAGSWDSDKVDQALSETKDYAGITGSITIDPKTGNRPNVPVVLLDVDDQGHYAIDEKWASFAGFSA